MPRSRNVLNEDQVRAIKEELARGKTQQEIAEKYDVSQPLISQINRGRRWSHVK